MYKNRIRELAACFFLTAALAACAETVDHGSHVLGEQSLRYGVVSAIDQVELDGNQQLGVGTVVGAAAGGIIGHQIGGGSGRDVATVLGVIGGGIAGNTVQNRIDRRPGQRISVRLDNGASLSITQPGSSQLRVGDRVVIEGDGRDARVGRG
jgi:outer membrane lipoprotein SlyB